MIPLLLLYFIPLSNAAPYREGWERFKVEFNKQYNSSEEENQRMKIFFENMAVIEKHNVKFRAGLSTFEMGINQYGDQSQEEFESRMLGMQNVSWGELPNAENLTILNESSSFEKSVNLNVMKSEAVFSFLGKLFRHTYVKVLNGLRDLAQDNLNETVDWVKMGAVTPAKDQGFCGSCWAFSAVGALEGQIYRKYGTLESLSVQNLIDCTRGEDSNCGCKGGLMDASFQYVIDNGGIASEREYPYEMKDSECRYEKKMAVGNCKAFAEIYDGEEALKYILKERGPLSVIMDASTIEFRFYKRGFYESLICSERRTNHAVLLVGYGEKEGNAYWQIKNSWGTKWGENGIARVSRWRSCGIENYGVYPIV